MRSYGEKKSIFIDGIKNFKIIPVPLLHGSLLDTGWLFVETKDCGGVKKTFGIVYLTDCNKIPEESIELIKRNCQNIEHLVIDGLRKESHSTHFSFEEALFEANKICAKHTWLTHITHNMSDDEINSFIQEKIASYSKLKKICETGGSVATAYDGLLLET